MDSSTQFTLKAASVARRVHAFALTDLNPWGLTQRECETLEAVCSTGCNKMAARSMGISSKTVEAHLVNAKQKMELSGLGPSRGPGRLLQVLAWDRWYRAVQAALTAVDVA